MLKRQFSWHTSISEKYNENSIKNPIDMSLQSCLSACSRERPWSRSKDRLPPPHRDDRSRMANAPSKPTRFQPRSARIDSFSSDLNPYPGAHATTTSDVDAHRQVRGAANAIARHALRDPMHRSFPFIYEYQYIAHNIHFFINFKNPPPK
ncbi:hypothetical protein [Burkholderia thailandensis]|uniref:hypothetical protein n=1 Tax=Burkholderia thailandensis TaxID=57975 RepID=UPI0029908213|nr:hypothetical protein [Burkholderia thailandensis]